MGRSEKNSYRAYQPLKLKVLRSSETSFYVKLRATYSNILEDQNPSLMILSMYQCKFNPLAPELFFLISAHSVYKM